MLGKGKVDVVEEVSVLRLLGARANGMEVPTRGTSGTQLVIMDRVAKKEVVVQTNLKLATKGKAMAKAKPDTGQARLAKTPWRGRVQGKSIASLPCMDPRANGNSQR